MTSYGLIGTKTRTLERCRPTARRTRSPSFDNVEDERRYRKQRLAAAFRLFGKFGFSEGTAGHITARDPERADHFWVNPVGMNFRQIKRQGSPAGQSRRRGGRGHLALQLGRVRHPFADPRRPTRRRVRRARALVYGKAWSILHRPLDPLTQDACAFYEDHAVFDDYTGAVVEIEEGKRIAHALGNPTRPPFWSTTGCSPSATPWTRRPGGSSPWSAAARPSCWRKPRAHRSRSGPRWPRRRSSRPGVTGRVGAVPAALRPDRRRGAGPARRVVGGRRCQDPRWGCKAAARRTACALVKLPEISPLPSKL